MDMKHVVGAAFALGGINPESLGGAEILELTEAGKHVEALGCLMHVLRKVVNANEDDINTIVRKYFNSSLPPAHNIGEKSEAEGEALVRETNKLAKLMTLGTELMNHVLDNPDDKWDRPQHLLVNWAGGGDRGGFYLSYNGASNGVSIGTNWGRAPRIEMVVEALRKALVIWWQKDYLPQTYKRILPARVTVRSGMSGAADFFLETIPSPTLPVPSRRAKLHISMYSKLNENFSAYLLDAIDLFRGLGRCSEPWRETPADSDYEQPRSPQYASRFFQTVLNTDYCLDMFPTTSGGPDFKIPYEIDMTEMIDLETSPVGESRIVLE